MAYFKSVESPFENEKHSESWQSVCMIPVARVLLQEKLNQLETNPNEDQPANRLNQLSPRDIQAYWKKYQHWHQAPLNSKQREWLQDIHLYLNCLQQTLFKSAYAPAPLSAPAVNQNPSLTLRSE